MRKFLLVLFVGMVVVMSVYGLLNEAERETGGEAVTVIYVE
jgi:hypothetical protein